QLFEIHVPRPAFTEGTCIVDAAGIAQSAITPVWARQTGVNDRDTLAFQPLAVQEAPPVPKRFGCSEQKGHSECPKETVMPIRATVWGENVHEQKNKSVAENYPKGMHGQIAALLSEDPNIVASTVTLQDAEHGMTEAKLDETDVLLWWGHAAHGLVD